MFEEKLFKPRNLQCFSLELFSVFNEFVDQLVETQEGWVSSHCG